MPNRDVSPLSFCYILKLEWKQMLTFDLTPKTKSDRPKNDFSNFNVVKNVQKSSFWPF